jgi:uncharacterized protein (TIGR00159 family)
MRKLAITVDVLETIRTITLGDIIDVAIVTVLIYCILIWFKQTRAAFVARGILIFAMVFFLARQMKMYLTTWIFQGFFAVFLIALVVIFQEELRRFFERLAALGPKTRQARPLQPKEVEILVRTIAQFAREKIGALVVLKGRDPLDRHLSGGWELDGALSEALIASIFDSHSEGHDGAVIVDGDRVVQFGVQLPLSREFRQLSGTGTRHAAALGLSEKTDAMCLAVSEQKGTISVAYEGVISVIDDLPSLQRRVNAFIKEKVAQPVKTSWPNFFRAHTTEKAVSLLVAIVLWVVFAQELKPLDRVFLAPIQVHNLPANLEIEKIRPERIKVRLAGLKRDFGMIDSRSIRIHIDLDGATPGGRRVLVSEDNLPIPRSLRLVNAEPTFVEVLLAETGRKSR